MLFLCRFLFFLKEEIGIKETLEFNSVKTKPDPPPPAEFLDGTVFHQVLHHTIHHRLHHHYCLFYSPYPKIRIDELKFHLKFESQGYHQIYWYFDIIIFTFVSLLPPPFPPIIYTFELLG